MTGPRPTPRQSPAPTPREGRAPGPREGRIPAAREGPTPASGEARAAGSRESRTSAARESRTPTPGVGRDPGPREGRIPAAREGPTPTSREGRAPGPRAGRGVSPVRLIAEDLAVVLDRDPSCSGRAEALLHAGWQGLALYRLAHRLHARGRRLSAAALTRLARLLTGMEIHAGARIGRRAFIDHGFGVVIGETAVVGDDVTLYHGVTLGSRGWLHDTAGESRRHPVLGDRVLIGTGASVLGPVTVGDGCRIAAHSLVLHDLPPAPPATRRPTADNPARPPAQARRTRPGRPRTDPPPVRRR
jgi:serine O-acetyltransferase